VDFVVAGFGLGAVMMLIGFAVRDLGPLRYRGSEGDGIVRRQWGHLCRTVGNAIVAGGFAVCLVTLVLLFADADDDFGARMVASVSAIAVIGSGVWTVFAVRRFAEATAGLPSALGSGGALSQLGPARRAYRSAATESWNRVDDEGGAGVQEQGAVGGSATSWPVRVEPAATGEAEPSREEEAPVLGPPLPAAPVATTAAPSTSAPVPVPPAPAAESPAPTPVAMTTLPPRGAFASPLLADVGTGGGADNGSGFRSSVLADIAAESDRERGGWGFSSSIFADLRSEGGDRGADEGVSGPPAPVVGPAVPVAEGVEARESASEDRPEQGPGVAGAAGSETRDGEEAEKKEGEGAAAAQAGSASSRE
jgi:hypothetical protein